MATSISARSSGLRNCWPLVLVRLKGLAWGQYSFRSAVHEVHRNSGGSAGENLNLSYLRRCSVYVYWTPRAVEVDWGKSLQHQQVGSASLQHLQLHLRLGTTNRSNSTNRKVHWKPIGINKKMCGMPVVIPEHWDTPLILCVSSTFWLSYASDSQAFLPTTRLAHSTSSYINRAKNFV